MDQRLKDARFHVAEALRALSQRPGDDDSLRGVRVDDFSAEECERLADSLRTLVDEEGYMCSRCEVVFCPCEPPSAEHVCEFCAEGEVQVKRDHEVDQARADLGGMFAAMAADVRRVYG